MTTGSSCQGLDAYDELAPVYDCWLSGDGAAGPCKAFYLALLAGEPGPVLELGVGTGRIARALEAAGTTCVGIDRSLPMLRQAQECGTERLVRASFAALPFRSCFATVIFPMRTTGHLLTLEERLEMLREVHSALVPGGRFVFDHYIHDPHWAATNHDRPILMYAGPFEGSTSLFVWDRYDFDSAHQRLQCSVTVEQISVEGRLLSTHTTTFDFGWLRPEQVIEEAHQAGFIVEALFGDFDGRALAADSEQLIAVLRRSGE